MSDLEKYTPLELCKEYIITVIGNLGYYGECKRTAIHQQLFNVFDISVSNRVKLTDILWYLDIYIKDLKSIIEDKTIEIDKLMTYSVVYGKILHDLLFEKFGYRK